MCNTANYSKCSKYNPNESTKQYDKSVVRKQAVLFSPVTVLEHLRNERAATGRAAGKTKEELLQIYMQVCGRVGAGYKACVLMVYQLWRHEYVMDIDCTRLTTLKCAV